MRGIAEANWSMRFLVSLGTSSAISERGMRLPRFARNDRGELLNKLFKKWTWPIYWAALPDESGNYKIFGGVYCDAGIKKVLS